MIPFLDLKAINAQYADELKEATARVIDGGWYIQGNECKAFERELGVQMQIEKGRALKGISGLSVESPVGTSPSGSHRTVLDSLPSHGSSYSNSTIVKLLSL